MDDCPSSLFTSSAVNWEQLAAQTLRDQGLQNERSFLTASLSILLLQLKNLEGNKQECEELQVYGYRKEKINTARAVSAAHMAFIPLRKLLNDGGARFGKSGDVAKFIECTA